MAGDPIPAEWLTVRTTMLYKKGPVKDATNYHPTSPATAYYRVLTKLIPNRLKPAIQDQLSPMQYSREGQTGTMQAAMITPTLDNMEGGYIMLLDIAKAFPSVHHTLLLDALRHKGVPHHILDMVQHIYRHGQFVYHHPEGDITFQPKRGVKEGCPMSPHLFMLTY